jgi:AAA+ ATPase superfamily predicted ATPase
MLAPDMDVTNKDTFFHGGHWGQCLELLTHLCQYSDSILLVTGPSGIGKSALKQALISNNRDKFVHFELQVKSDLTTAEAIDLIDRGFDAALRWRVALYNIS